MFASAAILRPGEPGLYGEFLSEAQGEDIVAGTRTPLPVREMRAVLPEAHAQLETAVAELERHYRDIQDVEFTVESGRFYLLQTRGAKRTATAALRAAVDMAGEGLLARDEAVQRIDPAQLEQLLHPTIDPPAELVVVGTGLCASPGAACGLAVFDANTAAARSADGEDIILVRPETTADDIHGLLPAQGILTARGGMTSHAAVVARGLGKPCVAGCAALDIDLDERSARIGDVVIREGDPLTIDGSTGRVILGLAPLVEPEPDANLATILEWADDVRRLRVYANADTPLDAERARKHGAEGIGLCRTEHMFMAADRLPIVREMILASTVEERAEALEQLLPMQQSDFEGIFEAMAGLPVTIQPARPAVARVPSRSRGGRGSAHSRADRVAARGEPDARHPRLPPRDRAAGDLRDADQGDRARRRKPSSGGRASCRSSRSCIRWSRSRPS